MSILIGITLVVVFACPVQERYYRRRVAECGGGIPPPEARLPLMMVGATVLPISLFIFSATSIKSVHWAGALVSGIPFGFALGESPNSFSSRSRTSTVRGRLTVPPPPLVGVYISANTYIAVAFSQYSASGEFRLLRGSSAGRWR